jgi:hypothetical protein
VPVWKPHALANEPSAPELVLKLGQKVVATVDVEGVPKGTVGKVMLANGFNWKRYRVLFANGVEVAHLDARHLEPHRR